MPGTRCGQCYMKTESSLDLSTRYQNRGVEGQRTTPALVVFSGDVPGGHFLCSQCTKDSVNLLSQNLFIPSQTGINQ